MKLTVLSVQTTTFKDDKTGQDRTMWRAYCPDSTGAVGSLYSTHPVMIGDTIEVIVAVNRDGKFVAKIKPASDANDGRSNAKKTGSDSKKDESGNDLPF